MALFGSQNSADELERLQLCDTDRDCDVQPTKRSSLPRGQIMKLAVAGMALIALLASPLCFHGVSPIILDAKIDKELDEVLDLAAESSGPTSSGKREFAGCEELAIIKDYKLVQNNLGGKGPDKGDEGMIYRASVYMKDVDSNVMATKALKVAIHAKSPYQGFPKNEFNGLDGKFPSILLHSGKRLNFSVSVYDEETTQPFTLPYFSITFFDLDMSEANRSSEYIIARHFEHYYVAKGTQLNITENADGTTTFHATQIGTGSDNPKESEALTHISKSKGVTLQYTNRNSTDFTIGTEDGKSVRGFEFILRPSMLCAKTEVNGKWMDPLDDSIPGVDLPLMDGSKPVSGMLIPILNISHHHNRIVITDPEGNNVIMNKTNKTGTDNENGTETVENASAIDENGTVKENGTETLDNGTATSVNGTDGDDTPNNTDGDDTPNNTGNSSDNVTKATRSKARPKSGTIAMLIVVTQLALWCGLWATFNE